MKTYILKKNISTPSCSISAGAEFIEDKYGARYGDYQVPEIYLKDNAWFKLKEEIELENVPQPLVTLNGHSGITWDVLNMKAGEIMESLNGFCYDDIKLVRSIMEIKSRRYPIEVKIK